MENEYSKITLNWLYELGYVDAPSVINNIYENIFLTNSNIQDVEIVINKENKTILVFLKLTWYSKLFWRAEIHNRVIAVLNKLLPDYKYRVTEDKKLLNLALEKARSYDKSFNSLPSHG